MKRITFLAVEPCLSSSITNLIDGFAIANLWHRALSGEQEDLFSSRIISTDGKPVSCSNGVQLQAHHSLHDSVRSDYLILPALLPIPEASSLPQPELLAYIRDQYRAGATVASVCTGAFLLAETGLLDGRTATTNWQFEKRFRFRYPDVKLEIGKILTETDRLICTGAVNSMMHLALRIIRRDGSPQLAASWAKAMMIDPNIDSQIPYTIFPMTVSHRDNEISRAEKYMRQHLAGPITIDQVAEHVGISPRHFKRRFKSATGDTPLSYLQKLRIENAKHRLENTLESIEEITCHIGYEDSRTFRRLFKRHTSLSPRAYRERFLLPES